MNPKYDIKDRKDFLLKMYDQLCNEIDRHIKVIWQTISLIISTIAIFALVEKNIISIDVATIIIIIILGLSIAYIIESNYWYNRNLVIIANIEKQFLYKTDTNDIHSYFSEHRQNNKIIDMMVIQLVFSFLLSILVLLFHLYKVIFPLLINSFKNYDIKIRWTSFFSYMNLFFSKLSFLNYLPYIFMILLIFLLIKFYKKRIVDYNKFVNNSPGIILK